MKILVTGGAGYIGSHVVKELIKDRHDVLVIDNLSTGNRNAVLSPAKLKVVDILSNNNLERVFMEFKPEAVMHFAALKNAGESVLKPNIYYENNICGSINLINCMVKHKVDKIIFSSSAAVYGDVTDVPITEETTINPISPYGKNKLMFEEILKDYDAAFDIKSVSLRYFNAGGADIEGKLGNNNCEREDLISILVGLAVSNNSKFIVNGLDYETKDGSPIRDLVHVNDLATAHIKALDYLNRGGDSEVINLGSENGFSVLEAVRITKEITGADFNIIHGKRRQGDIAVSIASSEKARNILNWNPKYSDLETIVRTAWEWECGLSKNFGNIK